MSYHVSITSKVVHPILYDDVIRASSKLGWGLVESSDGETLIQVSLSDGTKGKMHYQEGGLWTSNPSDEFMGYIIALSEELGGHVIGDEGESYLRDKIVSPVDALSPAAVRRIRIMSRFKLVSLYVFIFLIVLMISVLANRYG